jgi:hypothetical protein
MITPGIYVGLTMHDYLTMPAVSATLVKTVVERCARAGWFDSWLNPGKFSDDSTKAQNNGSIAHSGLLEGHFNFVEAIDPNLYPTKSSGNIPEGWTNKEIKAARDYAIASGKIPVLVSEFKKIQAMVTEARYFLESIRNDEPAIYEAFQPNVGDSELTMVWDDDGVLCRLRADRISKDRKLIVDYKTTLTSAEPDTWGRTQMVKMGFYTSAAFYRRGVRKLCGVSPAYAFLVQEQEPPYLCSLVGVDNKAFDLGSRKVERGLTIWRQCMKENRWPAYPTRMCYPEIPSWEFSRWEDAEGNAEQGIPYDTEKMGWKEARESVEKIGFEHERDPL